MINKESSSEPMTTAIPVFNTRFPLRLHLRCWRKLGSPSKPTRAWKAQQGKPWDEGGSWKCIFWPWHRPNASTYQNSCRRKLCMKERKKTMRNHFRYYNIVLTARSVQLTHVSIVKCKHHQNSGEKRASNEFVHFTSSLFGARDNVCQSNYMKRRECC